MQNPLCPSIQNSRLICHQLMSSLASVSSAVKEGVLVGLKLRWVHVCTCVYACVCTCVYACVCTRVCTCVYTYVCLYLCVHTCVLMHVCAHVCVYGQMCFHQSLPLPRPKLLWGSFITLPHGSPSMLAPPLRPLFYGLARLCLST